MIVDTSALLAILKDEPEAPLLLAALEQAEPCRISAANLLEATIITDANENPTLSRKLDDLIGDLEIVVEPFTAEQARIARDAYRDFGKGRGKPAQLNFGDCFAYALAKTMREPLLFKGNDFLHTDVEPAIR